MYISKCQVINYKSYLDSGEIEFKPGFNIVVGQNSAGKTALLEAIGLHIAWNPHRSEKTVPTPTSPVSDPSSVSLTFTVTHAELLSLLPSSDFSVVLPKEGFAIPGFGAFTPSNTGLHAFVAWLFGHSEFQIPVRLGHDTGERWLPSSPRFGLYPPWPQSPNGGTRLVVARIDANGSPIFRGSRAGTEGEDATEIGARLSDVFGADNIIWVEGQTEEECFPLILRKIGKRSLMGTAIVGIRQTGDLLGRNKKKVLEIYHRMSEANTLLPPTIAFVFDEECLTEAKKQELKKMGHGLVHFLPRRMYESYLLEPEAIAATVNAISGFRETAVSPDEVRQLLDRKREDRKENKQLRYFCEGTKDVPPDWERTIDAASVLEDIFRELSETRVEYEKTTHSVAISKWLIEHKPDAFNELADFLVSLVNAEPASKTATAS